MKVKIICDGAQLNKREDFNPFGTYIPDINDTICINEKDYYVTNRCFKFKESPAGVPVEKELIIKVIE